MTKLEIVGLSGQAGSGKDYIFEHHLKPLGYTRWALADHMKMWVIGKSQATYEEVFKTKPAHIRNLLQQTGTEEGRDVYGEDVWVKTTLAWLEHLSNTMDMTKVCITDIRFPNEVEFITKNGGKVFRIQAEQRVRNSPLSHEARQHLSETALNGYMGFSGHIWNDPQYSETVKQQIYTLLDLGPIIDVDPFNHMDKAFDKMDEAFEHMNDGFRNIFKNTDIIKKSKHTAIKWKWWKL